MLRPCIPRPFNRLDRRRSRSKSSCTGSGRSGTMSSKVAVMLCETSPCRSRGDKVSGSVDVAPSVAGASSGRRLVDGIDEPIEGWKGACRSPCDIACPIVSSASSNATDISASSFITAGGPLDASVRTMEFGEAESLRAERGGLGGGLGRVEEMGMIASGVRNREALDARSGVVGLAGAASTAS